MRSCRRWRSMRAGDDMLPFGLPPRIRLPGVEELLPMIQSFRKGASNRTKAPASRDAQRVRESIAAAVRNKGKRRPPEPAAEPVPDPAHPSSSSSSSPESNGSAANVPTVEIGVDVNNVSTVARSSPPAVDWVAVRKGLKLTLREVEVIQGIWAGQQFQQIARSLSISGHTCDTHWRHIRTKLGVHCRVGVVHAVYNTIIVQREET